MKTQKTLLAGLTIALFTVTLAAHAQTAVSLRVGMNLSNVHLVNESGDKQDTKAIPRMQIGLTVDIPLAGNFAIQPAALYSGKGFKQKGGWLAAPEDDFKAAVSYVEVPVNFLYKPALGNGKLLIGAGPYVGYGTGGTWEAEGRIVVGDIVLSENEGDVIFRGNRMDGEFGNYLYGKPWDYGANMMVGYEFFRKLAVQLNAQLGIANLSPFISEDRDAGKIRNRGYGLSVAYRL